METNDFLAAAVPCSPNLAAKASLANGKAFKDKSKRSSWGFDSLVIRDGGPLNHSQQPSSCIFSIAERSRK